MKGKASVRLNFHTQKQLDIIFSALSLEAKRPAVIRSRVSLKKDGAFLVLEFEASDTIALRAALNAYLRWISGISNVLRVLENA